MTITVLVTTGGEPARVNQSNSFYEGSDQRRSSSHNDQTWFQPARTQQSYSGGSNTRFNIEAVHEAATGLDDCYPANEATPSTLGGAVRTMPDMPGTLDVGLSLDSGGESE